MKFKKLILKNLSDTEKLAKLLANELILYSEIYLLLNGNLGSGKTTLTKYIIKNLNIIENVSSPTFVILNQYQNNKIKINHMDCYRLNNKENLNLYIEEFQDSINIIEWPDIWKTELKSKKIINIYLKIITDNIREYKISTNFKSNLI